MLNRLYENFCNDLFRSEVENVLSKYNLNKCGIRQIF